MKLPNIQKAIACHEGFVVWNQYPCGINSDLQQTNFYYLKDSKIDVIIAYGRHRIQLLHYVDMVLGEVLNENEDKSK
jgi:hypothetical protein